MINVALTVRGKTWGQRLKRRLRKPPLGFYAWLEAHTKPLRDDSGGYVGAFQMRDMPCYLKLYRGKFLLHVIPTLLRLSQPMRTFRKAVALAANGVPISRPLACVLVKEGVLMLSEGLYSVADYSRLWQAPPAKEEAERMMHCAGATLAAVHTAGYSHGNCRWDNLLWSEGECYLVDLDGTRRRRFRVAHHRARDLARFTVNAEEAGVSSDLLEVFLNSYLEVMCESQEPLIARMRPHLKKLRRRHESKYGIVAAPLL